MKRSRSIALVMMGAGSLILSACEEPTVEALVYKDVQQCLDDSTVDLAVCEESFKQAAAQHARVAPKYTDPAACEADFGAGQCELAPYQTESGGSVFMPLMMGYMMGSMLGGRGGVAAQPLYRSSDDAKNYRTADNRSVGSTTGKTTVSRSAAAAPASKPYTVSRGGFGARARSFGSAST
ncbi:MAG: DUF1190 domain-containing protein [Rhodospirillales bacterium]|nr:DUF1190 domain-containing protein [Rhodospirillales bacterium]